MPAGHVCQFILRGQLRRLRMRPMPAGPLLSILQRDNDTLPRRILLPKRLVGIDAVPRRFLLLARLRRAHGMPKRHHIECRLKGPTQVRSGRHSGCHPSPSSRLRRRAYSLQGWILLPRVRLAHQVPRGLLLPRRSVCAYHLPLRLQVPSRLSQGDSVRAALLLPKPRQRKPDLVPAGLHLPVRRHVRPAALQPRVVCLLRRQGPMRPVSGRPLLSDGVELYPMPRRQLLPEGVVGAGGVPGGLVLQDRGIGAHLVPEGEHVDGRGFQQDPVRHPAADARPASGRPRLPLGIVH